MKRIHGHVIGYLFSGLIISSLMGCASLELLESEPKPIPRKTLADLDLQPVVVKPSSLPGKSLESLQQSYDELLSVIEQPELREQLSYRLADVEILLAEKQQELAVTVEDGYYSDAILAYQSILTQYPGQPANGEILYQLSRAYDLQGQQANSVATLRRLIAEYPQHSRRSEAWFRLGEFSFAQNNYPEAIESYNKVVKGEPQSEFFPISAYMLGWSHFKLEQYDGSLHAYTAMLDSTFEQQDTVDFSSHYQALPKGQLKLVKDTLRIMGLLFSYAGNAKGVERFYQKIGHRPYEHLIYDELAQQHLNNDRYRDSADVLRSFVELYPQHPQSIGFFVRHIDAYILGDFPSLVLPAKEDFVEVFGITGAFADALFTHPEHPARAYLHPYIKELAQFEHSFAQQVKARVSDETLAAEKKQNLIAQQALAYQKAARWYREFMQTFPSDPDVMNMHFYLAEALFEAEQFNVAANEYTAFSRTYPEHEQSANAAYSAILAVQRLPENEQNHRLQRLLTVQKEFVDRFVGDARAVPVAEQLMRHYFASEAYQQAGSWSQWLLANVKGGENPQDMARLLASARLIRAHSDYALDDFEGAELGYRELLAKPADLVSLEGIATEKQIEERLAASIYKQAEKGIAEKQIDVAVAHLKRILSDTPGSELRIAAQFDAATYLLDLSQWGESIALLEDFQQQYPNHTLANDIPEKLLFAYEQNAQWLDAAQLLKVRWQNDKASETGREALLVAADYFLKGNDDEASLISYRTYAHTYPEPFAEAMEARFIMSEFYRKSGEKWKRDFWFRKIIAAQKTAGEAVTQRTTYLAAMAELEFAKDADLAFSEIPLNQPLNKSLVRKQQALEKAVSGFNKVIGYGVADFTTVANFRLGNIYQTLAESLMGFPTTGKIVVAGIGTI